MATSALVYRLRWLGPLLLLLLVGATTSAPAQPAGTQGQATQGQPATTAAATTAPPSATSDQPPPASAPPPAKKGTAAAGDAEIQAAACSNKTDGPLPSSPNLARIQGVIISPLRELPDVTLILVEKKTSNHYVLERVPTRCTSGQEAARSFAYWIEVPPGTYDLSLSAPHYESHSVSGITVAGNEIKQQDLKLVRQEEGKSVRLLWLPLAFLLSIWLVRWNNIAKPSRLGVLAQLDDLKRLLSSGSPPSSGSPLSSGSSLIQELDRAGRKLNDRWAVLDWLFWSRGQELASWSLIHKADLELLAAADLEKINARLASVQQRLVEIDKSTAKSLVERIAAELKCEPAKINKEARRQVLIEATSYLFDFTDTEFASLTSWQNKAVWLTLVGVLLILGVGASEGHAALFLAGAVGGFLSRLTRELKRADVPTDYGASWSTLFLSPVAGAIAGWFGVALIMLLNDPTVGVLAGPLKIINWDAHNTAATLAAAFVLGFSERLFDRIVSQLEEAIDKKKEGAQKASSKPPDAPQAPAPPKPGMTSMSPSTVAPGGEVTAQLENLDAAKVKGVVLTQAGSADRQVVNPRAEAGKLKFTIAADTPAGTYRIVLLAPDRIETGKDLRVSEA
ncbi:MAG TPA: carboxypeptidase-like regulatory domain-containing protein [Thermoanaerobaculia bacterium]|nr:carboxypeptidase-like regulatory domain-containing protein [Thermoanaerobaculia bacterium]